MATTAYIKMNAKLSQVPFLLNVLKNRVKNSTLLNSEVHHGDDSPGGL